MLELLALGVALAGPVPAAIESSVQERMGDVQVTVVNVRCDGTKLRGCDGAGPVVQGSDGTDPAVRVAEPGAGSREPGLTAIPEAGARLGRQMRFVIVSNGERLGSVVAEIDVIGVALRASRGLRRGEELGADTVEAAEVLLEGVLLRRLPGAADLAGAKARRDIRAGEILTDTAVVVPPTVRTGDEVRVTIADGPIVVSSVGRASGSGRIGDLIRVLVPRSRKGLKARITGPGAVEIVR